MVWVGSHTSDKIVIQGIDFIIHQRRITIRIRGKEMIQGRGLENRREENERELMIILVQYPVRCAAIHI